jgi:hypothetical protein
MRNAFFLASSLLVLALVPGCLAPGDTGEVLTDSSQVLARGPIAVSAAGIFFFNFPTYAQSEDLVRIPLDGGAPVTLASTDYGADWMVMDQDSVFYSPSNDGTSPATSFTIFRVPQAGGAVQTQATGTSALTGVAVAGGQLAFATLSDGTSGGAVFVQPIAPVGQPPADPVAVAQGLPGPCAVASDGAKVYWLDCASKEILSLPSSPATGETPAVVASGLDIPGVSLGVQLPLAVAAGQLYWVEGTAVRTMPAAGGTPSTIADESDWAPAQILADGAAVYWRTRDNYAAFPSMYDVNDRDPGLWTAHAGGGSVDQVLGLAASPSAVAMDADYLYWIKFDASVCRSPR